MVHQKAFTIQKTFKRQRRMQEDTCVDSRDLFPQTLAIIRLTQLLRGAEASTRQLWLIFKQRRRGSVPAGRKEHRRGRLPSGHSDASNCSSGPAPASTGKRYYLYATIRCFECYLIPYAFHIKNSHDGARSVFMSSYPPFAPCFPTLSRQEFPLRPTS